MADLYHINPFMINSHIINGAHHVLLSFILLYPQLLEEGEDVVPPAAEAKEGESKMDVSGKNHSRFISLS